MNCMKRYIVIVSTLFVVATAAGTVWAEQKPASQSVTLAGAGWEVHNKHGEGVMLVFQAVSVPSEIWANFDTAGQKLCNAFAAKMVPVVLEKTNNENPAFVSVMLKKGNSFFGSYRRAYYAFEDGKCGGAL